MFAMTPQRPELRVSTYQDEYSNSDNYNNSFRSIGNNGTTVKKIISMDGSPS